MKKILLLSLLATPLAMADISLGTPQQPEADRIKRLKGWQRAVACAKVWSELE